MIPFLFPLPKERGCEGLQKFMDPTRSSKLGVRNAEKIKNRQQSGVLIGMTLFLKYKATISILERETESTCK